MSNIDQRNFFKWLGQYPAYPKKTTRRNTIGVGLTRSRANSLYRHRINPLLSPSQGFIRAQIGHQDGELAFFYRYLHKPQPLALYIMHKAGVRCFSVRTVLFPQMDYSPSPHRKPPSPQHPRRWSAVYTSTLQQTGNAILVWIVISPFSFSTAIVYRPWVIKQLLLSLQRWLVKQLFVDLIILLYDSFFPVQRLEEHL